jgi:hypothetical protein|tara:strand:- start:521 stop:877 length:357 start_codon:yes stop_codon:yes gene_type:complete
MSKFDCLIEDMGKYLLLAGSQEAIRLGLQQELTLISEYWHKFGGYKFTSARKFNEMLELADLYNKPGLSDTEKAELLVKIRNAHNFSEQTKELCLKNNELLKQAVEDYETKRKERCQE